MKYMPLSHGKGVFKKRMKHAKACWSNMSLRYRTRKGKFVTGGGIGHASTREATDFFKQDCDSHDAKRALEEDDEDYNQMQYEPPNRSRSVRDDEEEDYGYN